jgi:hypothetical protein
MGRAWRSKVRIFAARLARRRRGAQTMTFFMVAIMTRVDESAPAAGWGKKWGKVPHRFQPIST